MTFTIIPRIFARGPDLFILKLALRNLDRHARKTLLLIGLIACGVAASFVANAIFEGTNQGLQRTFIGSLTGDAALCLPSETPFSLFGSEVPIVSEYESIPPLVGHTSLLSFLAGNPEVSAATSIVSAAAVLECAGYSQAVPLFGVDPATYFTVCSDVKILSGSIQSLQDSGVFLNAVLAGTIERALQRPLVIGEPIRFSMYVGNSFRVRSAPFAGVHAYVGTNEALDRVVLADLTTVRSLADYTLGYGVRETAGVTDDALGGQVDLDSLFGSAVDIVADTEQALDLANLEANLADTAERDALVMTDAGAWSFILVRAVEGRARQLVKSLRGMAAEAAFDVKVLDWQAAAGSVALTLVAVRAVFYIGLGFIAIGAILVIVNALVISVLERTAEIGTMRGVGASAGFIRSLFIAESLIIVLVAAAIGLALGTFVVLLLGQVEIRLSNQLLIALFGGLTLQARLSVSSFILHVVMVVVVGGLAWIYPVSVAMHIQPLAAMNRGGA
ncbi:MAG: hypothetical protein A2Y32_06865 [Spirochaetes bacterium GWF1_60_12]|nr:MAG: hypothetical protein A2Y32_06865 [Spirochaetes bacterium GWF1_60_12]